jgi:NAD(P)-dependent dehydrogenase (short-subunit alcohol dehydrogenase family)
MTSKKTVIVTRASQGIGVAVVRAFLDRGYNECSHSWAGLSCPECEERSYLKMLVAELLYRNQVLRFDLIEARDQVERIHRVGSDRRGDACGN